MAVAQERQLELRLTVPVKRNVQSQETELGGKVYIPAGNFTIVGNVDYRQATNLFFSPEGLPTPTDAVNAGAEVWFFPFDRSKKVFLTGGIARSAFLGQPDATTAITGVGFVIQNGSTFVIPQVTFNTDDLEGDRTVLDKTYNAKVYIHVPISAMFNLNFIPEVSRLRLAATGQYVTQAKVSVGIAIKK